MEYVVALTLHIFSVVVWIGGVTFVTLVTFPMILRMEKSLEMVMMFQGTEHRFVKIAKAMVILAGLSGFYLMYEKGLSTAVIIMLVVWAVYASLIFGLERILFAKLFGKPEDKKDMTEVFKILQWFHWIILALSYTAIIAGVYEAHY